MMRFPTSWFNKPRPMTWCVLQSGQRTDADAAATQSKACMVHKSVGSLTRYGSSVINWSVNGWARATKWSVQGRSPPRRQPRPRIPLHSHEGGLGEVRRSSYLFPRKKGALIDLPAAYNQYADWFFMRNIYYLVCLWTHEVAYTRAQASNACIFDIFF